MEKLRNYTDREFVRQKLTEQVGMDAGEKRVSDITSTARASIRIATGRSGQISFASVENLTGNIAGQYNTLTNGISMDENLILNASSETNQHVALHEANHAYFNNHRNGQRINVDLEEGMNELLTKRTTGRTLAYQREQGMVGDMARSNHISVGKIVDLFRDADSNELNRLHTNWQNPSNANQSLEFAA